jgi:serine/threonine-protein kinase RsbW
MSEELVVRLTFPAKPDYLLLARLALAGLARKVPVDDEALADLKLAVTEACGNAVRHAYADELGDVVVSYRVRGDLLEIIVEDQGAGIDMSDVPRESGLPLPDGGMGMAIIRAVVDELDIERGADGRGTVVRMAKRLAYEAGPSQS